jgi:hypothetical protein
MVELKGDGRNQQALGSLVEAFELMVAEARESAILLIERDPHHSRLVSIALHHQNLTAKPIIDIFRAVAAEIIIDAVKRKAAASEGKSYDLLPLRFDLSENPLDLTIQDREALFGALKAIHSEYDDIQSARNGLLHATWLIGYPSKSDPKGEGFEIYKYAASANGLSRIMTLPKTREELEHLANRCDRVRSWIGAVYSCLGGPLVVKETFRRDGGNWCLYIGQTKLPLLERQTATSF